MKMSEENKKKMHEILKLCMEINEIQDKYIAELQTMPEIDMVTIYVREYKRGYENAERIVAYTDTNVEGYEMDEVIHRLKEIIQSIRNNVPDVILNNFLNRNKEVSKDENRS